MENRADALLSQKRVENQPPPGLQPQLGPVSAKVTNTLPNTRQFPCNLASGKTINSSIGTPDREMTAHGGISLFWMIKVFHYA